MREADLPPGFVRFAIDGSDVVCAEAVADSIREALRGATLFEYAAAHPEARTLVGRGVVFAVPLPGNGGRAVVRHNRHGGMFARVTRDLFRGATRAPRELQISERLREYGVPTPPMLAFAIYPVLAGFKRVDVVTREVTNSADLSAAFMSPDVDRRARAVRAAADLVLTMSNVGARHSDLNVKNVLLQANDDGSVSPFVLDVDCVTFDEPEIVLELNLARLLRSAKKWQTLHGAVVTDTELDELAGLVRERRPPPMPLSTSS